MWNGYHRGCTGAVVVIDADGTTPHDAHGSDPCEACRWCCVHRRANAQDMPAAKGLGFRAAVGVPVQALESWLLDCRSRVPQSPPQSLHRRTAKLELFGSITPAPSQVERVCGEVLAGLTRERLDVLATRQPSFHRFRQQVEQMVGAPV